MSRMIVLAVTTADADLYALGWRDEKGRPHVVPYAVADEQGARALAIALEAIPVTADLDALQDAWEAACTVESCPGDHQLLKLRPDGITEILARFQRLN